MKRYFEVNHWASRLTLAAFAMAMLSPAAHADHWRRYKGAPAYDPPAVRHVHYAPQRVVYLERHSDAAPLFAGLIGGIVLGSILSQSRAPAPAVEPAVYYWDPWCHERFASLALYQSHVCRVHHPKVLRVVAVESGDCLDTYCWHDGGWRSEPRWNDDGDWGHRGDRDD